MPFGALLGGLFGLGGAAISAKHARQQGREQRAWQREENLTDRTFQERMYGSRYQMQMDDMRASGLNPILSYATGAGRAPSGRGGQGAMAQTPDFGGSMARGASAFSQAGLQAQQRKTEKEKQRNIIADTDYKVELAELQKEFQKTQRDQRFKWGFDNALTAQNSAAARSLNVGRRLEADIDKTKYGEIMRFLDRGTKSISPFTKKR